MVDLSSAHQRNSSSRPIRGSGHAASQSRQSYALSRLASHMDVAWDLDGTLVDHPASPVLHRFILETPHIRHILVSFRSERHGIPWERLTGYGCGLSTRQFERAIHMPDELCPGVSGGTGTRRGGRWPQLRLPAPPWRRVTDTAHRYWKGQICQQEGFTALVDDLTSLVQDGCRRHGVELFHPSDFLPEQ